LADLGVSRPVISSQSRAEITQPSAINRHSSLNSVPGERFSPNKRRRVIAPDAE
jgi:hypothetical protein